MIRCKGCGIGLEDDPRYLAVHIAGNPHCLAEYNDHTIWYRGREIVWGTLHIWEQASDSKGGKWRIVGLDRNGKVHRVHAEATQTKALSWIETANRKPK